MAQASYSAEAERDLHQIVQYIARDNLFAALEWLEQTRAICDLLAAQPGMGQRIQAGRFGEVRRHAVGNFLIYYQPTIGAVHVVRVVHWARDQGKLI